MCFVLIFIKLLYLVIAPGFDPLSEFLVFALCLDHFLLFLHYLTLPPHGSCFFFGWICLLNKTFVYLYLYQSPDSIQVQLIFLSVFCVMSDFLWHAMILNSCSSDVIDVSIECGVISPLLGEGESKVLNPGAESNLKDDLLRDCDTDINSTVEGFRGM